MVSPLDQPPYQSANNLPVTNEVVIQSSTSTEDVQSADSIDLDDWYEMVQAGKHARKDETSPERAVSNIPPATPFKRRSIGKVVLEPVRQQLGDTVHSTKSRSRRIMRRPREDTEPVTSETPTPSMSPAEFLEIIDKARKQGDEHRKNQEPGQQERRSARPKTEAEREYFDPQSLLDLDEAMSEAIRDTIHAIKERTGVDKLDPADLPRVKAAARRKLMRGYLGDDYSDDLSGRVEAARLETVKRYGDTSTGRKTGDNGRESRQQPRDANRPAASRTTPQAETSRPKPDTGRRPKPNPTPSRNGNDQTPPSRGERRRQATSRDIFDDAIRYAATPSFGTISKESIANRLANRFGLDEHEAADHARVIHNKIVDDGFWKPEKEKRDRDGNIIGYVYSRQAEPEDILKHYGVAPEQPRPPKS